MSSVPMPKAARAAVVVALLIAAVSALSIRSGPIMLLGVCFAALCAATGILQRRAWSAWGFAFLLVLSVLVILFFGVTGQYAGSFAQIAVTIVLYSGMAGLFAIAGHMLVSNGGKRGTPVPWILMVLLLGGPFVVFRPVNMPSSAMEDTLMIGDSVLVARSSEAPHDGEIVAFQYPLDRQEILVRRVAGVPGDRIRVVSGVLYRNGAAVNEPYVTRKKAMVPAGEVARVEVTVPSNKYFVLGDCRNDSKDSRHWGLVDGSDIIGRPKYVYDSLAPEADDVKPADEKSGERDTVLPVHPPLRRWERIFVKVF